MNRFALLIFSLFLFTETHAKTYVVSQHAENASDNNMGTLKNPFKSISAAAEKAGPGDTVLVYSGIYRERVAPERGGESGKYIVYITAPDENVIIKGSNVWNHKWKEARGHKNIYVSDIPLEELGDYNPFYIRLERLRYTRQKHTRRTLGQIFVNGIRLAQVDSLHQVSSMPATWMMSYDSTKIYLHMPWGPTLNPNDCLVEYAARAKVFAPHKRFLGYIRVEGFIMEHCANQFPSGFYHAHEGGHPQAGVLSTRSGHHWTIRRNIIRFGKNLGLDCGYEGRRDPEGKQHEFPEGYLENEIGHHVIEYNRIHDNGCGGIAGARQHASVIRYNLIENNAHLGIPAPENGGIKVHFFYNGLIEGNIIRNNHCSGIWLDNEWYGSRVTRNVITQNAQGVFIELGKGDVLVDNNIIARNTGEGIYMHDASGATIVHNLLAYNGHYGYYGRIVTNRKAISQSGKKEEAGCGYMTIKNNVFIDNQFGQVSLPIPDGEKVLENQCDYNLYIGGTKWNWEGMDYNTFCLTASRGKDEIQDRLKETFLAAGLNDKLDYEIWRKRPLLTLDQWRKLSGYDQNSLIPAVNIGQIENGAIEKGSISLSAYGEHMIIKNGQIFSRSKVPMVDNELVKRDFFGFPISGQLVVPGPFQRFGDKEDIKVLRPVDLSHVTN